ncbi:MAG: cobyric acid synthase [Candidatus Omnitrophota bacterium]|nr:cobyric acid synthase [Candidatus Omnitrophota bacterium]
MKQAKTLMVWGTASGVGKSVLVSALCRIFLRRGLRVCPFKAQNMSLNSYVTLDGGEIARAQVVQAQAARLEPDVDMNPVLLKPSSNAMAQVILRGRPIGKYSALQYKNLKARIWGAVTDSLDRLRKDYDLVIMEGAGSPAEINLSSHDIANLKIADYAQSPVLLAGDIDKGGVFASLYGTLALLPERSRRRIQGLIINKFRGDKRLLKSGLEYIKKVTGKKVCGVIPYFKDILIPEEDSANIENKKNKTGHPLKIAVLKLPHISNFTDFDSLAYESDVDLSYAQGKKDLEDADMLIIPGSKNTLGDTRYLHNSGLTQVIKQSHQQGALIFGVCGGFQMLGVKIVDPLGVESDLREIRGIGLLKVETSFGKEKILRRVKGRMLRKNIRVRGYEIHHGLTNRLNGQKALFEVTDISGKSYNDGAVSNDGRVYGSYLHGVFDQPGFRNLILNKLRMKKGLPLKARASGINLDAEFEKLADLVENNMDMKELERIINAGN